MSTDWEQQYQIKETPWDKGSPAPPLLEWIENNPQTLSGRIMVPGCGLGHDVRAIASVHGSSFPVGMDIAPSAVDAAKGFQTTGNESFELADLFDLSEQHISSFDWIWEHTCFCAIDPEMRESYVAAVHSALRPGGQLLGVFYLDPYDDEHPPGEGPPHGSTVAELTERFVDSGKFRLHECYVPSKSYPGRKDLEQILRLEKI